MALVVMGVVPSLTACDGDLPPAPAVCRMEAETIVPSGLAGAADCNAVAEPVQMAVRDGVLYFRSRTGVCAADSTGFRLVPAAESPIRHSSRQATDGTFIYGVSESATEARLWRSAPGGPQEDLGLITRIDDGSGASALPARMAAAEDHVDVVFNFRFGLHRFDLATRTARLLFGEKNYLYLLGADVGVSYVNYAWGDEPQPDRALARVDDSGVATGLFAGPLPPPPRVWASAVHLAGDRAYAGIKMSYHEGPHVGVVTMPRTGFVDGMVFCKRVDSDVHAIAVEGDTMYVAMSDQQIVRVRL